MGFCVLNRFDFGENAVFCRVLRPKVMLPREARGGLCKFPRQIVVATRAPPASSRGRTESREKQGRILWDSELFGRLRVELDRPGLGDETSLWFAFCA